MGDDDQSIYGWRGADVRNMQEFLKDFPGAKLVRLEENYRSTQVVLDAANGVIAENSGRIGKTLTTRRRGGESVTLVAAADERDEAEWVVRELQKRSAAADWQYSEMAVLYRTNSQSRALEEAFRRAGVPYRLIGAISFYERREVKDLLAYLRLVSNPSDDEAFLRAVGVPRRGLGETSLATLGRAAAQWGKPLLDTARIADRIPDLRPNVREAFRNFAALIDGAAQKRELPPADLLEHLIRAIDYEAVLHAEGPEGADRWENVRELVASAANWSEVVPVDTESGRDRRWSASWRRQRCSPRSTRSMGQEQGVTLMTLHTAKGLEWPVVVMSGARARPVSAGPSGGTTLRPGRGAPALLCGAHPGQGQALPDLGSGPAPRRRARPGIASRFLQAIPPGIIEERRTTSLWAPDWGQRGSGAAGRYGASRSVALGERTPRRYRPRVALPRTSRPRTLPATSKASGSGTGVSAAGRSRDSWAPGATSRYRWPSMTRKSV